MGVRHGLWMGGIREGLSKEVIMDETWREREVTMWRVRELRKEPCAKVLRQKRTWHSWSTAKYGQRSLWLKHSRKWHEMTPGGSDQAGCVNLGHKLVLSRMQRRVLTQGVIPNVNVKDHSGCVLENRQEVGKQEDKWRSCHCPGKAWARGVKTENRQGAGCK